MCQQERRQKATAIVSAGIMTVTVPNSDVYCCEPVSVSVGSFRSPGVHTSVSVSMGSSFTSGSQQYTSEFGTVTVIIPVTGCVHPLPPEVEEEKPDKRSLLHYHDVSTYVYDRLQE